MAVDFPAQIRELRTTLESILEVSDMPGLRKQVAELSEQASAPDLWDDPERAQAVTSKLSHVQSELDRLGARRAGSTISRCSSSSPRPRTTPRPSPRPSASSSH